MPFAQHGELEPAVGRCWQVDDLWCKILGVGNACEKKKGVEEVKGFRHGVKFMGR
jgi:hypothetical protein